MSFVQLGKDKRSDQEVSQDLDYESRLTVKDFFDSKIERSIKFMCSKMKSSHKLEDAKNILLKVRAGICKRSHLCLATEFLIERNIDQSWMVYTRYFSRRNTIRL